MMKKLFTVVALLCATTVSLYAQTPDWYKNGENYFSAVNKNTADNFTMTVMGTIDGVRCDDAFEIGVFCGEECRLSQPFYSTSPVFEYFGYFSMLTVRGEKGETFSFRLYDHRNQVEVEAVECPQQIDFKADASYGSFNNGLYDLAFSGSTTHRAVLEIDDATDLPFSGTQYSITADGIVCSYTRNAYLDGGYETIVLPFDADISEIKALGFVFEKFEGIGDNTIRFVELEDDEMLQAGVAYIFRYAGDASDGRKEIVFTANMDQMSDELKAHNGWAGTFKAMDGFELEGKYILNIVGDKMQRAGSGASLPPYHAYLELPAEVNIMALSVSHRGVGDVTEIERLQVDYSSEDVFDIQGRKLKNASMKGIVISNNKKYYIK